MRQTFLLLPCLAATIALAACERSQPESEQAGTPAETSTASGSTSPLPGAAAAGDVYASSRLVELPAAETDKAVSENGLCDVGQIDKQPLSKGPVTVADPKAVTIRGWVGNPRTKTAPAQAGLRFEQVDSGRVWAISASALKNRGDVAQHHGEAMFKSGFAPTLDLSGLAPGEYAIAPTFVDDGRVVSCGKDGAYRLVIGG